MTSPAQSQLELRRCTKTYPGPPGGAKTVAVDDISLEIAPGQVVAVVGSNGAGKSTLLSIIAGSTLPEAGSVLIDGKDVTHLPSWSRAGYVGRVRQNPEHNVLPTLTVEENFALALAYQRRGFRLRVALTNRVRQLVREALRPFGMGLEDKLGVLAHHLSGGQRQAVAVAMATVRRPSVLLLDEHVAALDPNSARAVMAETSAIVEELGITTVMVTHDMGRALEHSDRLLMMHRGRVIMDLAGREKDQMGVPELVRRFEGESGTAVPDRSILT